jgi:molybdenum cofactor cytidylyltransferase
MISAIILAAGESKRMGRPKMLLPWGDTTVLGKVVATFRAAGLEDIVVVTGSARPQVEALFGRSVRFAFNPDFARGEMLGSVQAGLQSLGEETRAALIALGDQPQVELETIETIRETFGRTGAPLLVPSYQMRRGHPWLVAREFWGEILQMRAPESPRDFLNRHAESIRYLNVETPSVIQDLDTPEDYERGLIQL